MRYPVLNTTKFYYVGYNDNLQAYNAREKDK